MSNVPAESGPESPGAISARRLSKIEGYRIILAETQSESALQKVKEYLERNNILYGVHSWHALYASVPFGMDMDRVISEIEGL